MADAGHIVITRELMPEAAAVLADSPRRIEQISGTGPVEQDALIDAARGAAALIVTVEERVDEGVLEAAGSGLRIVANIAVGTDNVDLAACAARDIIVTNTPDVLSEATADLAMGLLIAVARRLLEADAFVREGRPWAWHPAFLVGAPVSGATLGIVGLGRIGRAVARRAQAFGMDVVAATSPSGAADEDIRRLPLEALVETADFVSLHTPLTPQTRHLIGEAELRRMPAHSILINTARGGCVDQAALIRALQDGWIAGAGLDVYDDEPHVPASLRSLHNVVLTPHVGSADSVTRTRMCLLAVDNVLRVLEGRPARTPVSS